MPGSREVKTVIRKRLHSDIQRSLSGARNILILGSKRSGKTTLLKNTSADDLTPVYIPLKNISTSPEGFSVEFIARVLSQALGDDFTGIKKSPGFFRDEIAAVQNELDKIKPDQRLLVRTALSLPGALKAQGKELLLKLDDLDELLEMNNYPQIKDIMSMLDLSSARYMLASSRVSLLGETEGLDIMDCSSLEEDEARELISAYPDADADQILRITRHAFSLRCICESGIASLTDPSSHLYTFLSFCFDDMISRARGKTLLKSVLNVLARHKQLKLSEIARKVYRSAPVTKSILERLVAADMLDKDKSTFRMHDPLLRIWHLARIDDMTAEELDKKLEDLI